MASLVQHAIFIITSLLAVSSLTTAAAATTTSLNTFSVWHITDVHVDPYYEVGAFAGSGCYCETHDACPRMPDTCTYTSNTTLASGPFGNAEENCATPPSLWESAMEFMSATNAAEGGSPIVLFTGDFGEAGLSDACSPNSTAQSQILTSIARTTSAVRLATSSFSSSSSSSSVFGCLGNHDTAPGDVFGSTEDMSWLYTNLTESFGATFANDTQALASLLHGGWYSTRVTTLPATSTSDLYIISLNTNYWTTLNPELTNTSGPAYALGIEQFTWLNTTLATIAQSSSSSKAWIIGHIPPTGFWLPGFYEKFAQIASAYTSIIVASFFGHTHVDQTTVVRACNPLVPGQPIDWIITPDVDWCSGGNLNVGDVFQAGLWQNDAWCPLLPSNVSSNSTAAALECEAVCGNLTACAGFTWYPKEVVGSTGSCCFRTDVSNMPLNSSSPAVCYAKPACASSSSSGGSGSGNEQQGDEKTSSSSSSTILSSPQAPIHTLYCAPSLTEGFPASNPGLRRMIVDSSTFEIVDIITYYGNLTTANANWAFVWEEEYSFLQAYNMPDMSVTSWVNAVNTMASSSSAASASPEGEEMWDTFWTSYRKQYDGPSYVPCEDTCKMGMLQFLNGTGLGRGGEVGKGVMMN